MPYPQVKQSLKTCKLKARVFGLRAFGKKFKYQENCLEANEDICGYSFKYLQSAYIKLNLSKDPAAWKGGEKWSLP